jgi:nitroimidazol reductase NimA-like FMN-containing flavoprotein (pyridoxamine 5'-phosphate oxidase superfamily)
MADTELDPPPRRLTDLSSGECWELLRARPYGRLAWAGAEGVSVIPVNYLAEEGRLLLNTAAYTSLAQEGRDREVAFQVDQIDEETRSGWSVLVRGRLREVEPGVDQPDPDVWASGTRRMRFAVEPREVTGLRLASG